MTWDFMTVVLIALLAGAALELFFGESEWTLGYVVCCALAVSVSFSLALTYSKVPELASVTIGLTLILGRLIVSLLPGKQGK